MPGLAALDGSAATINVDKDRTLFAEGDPAEFCYRILGGAVRMVKQMADGRRQVTEFLLPGDLVGLDAFDRHDLAAETVMSTTLTRYRRAAVEHLAEDDPALARQLRAQGAERLRAAHERITMLGRRTASERLARFLLEMEHRAPRGGCGRVVLPMGRADIADHLGLTPETVCRLLSCLRHEGTIGTGRAVDGAEVTILDPRALAAVASDPRH
ncbi:MAG: helix-turn-helix domain-containing protein [Rhodospirillales bacterium]|nr:helix-turn-helix domain-containing protein [Rhodospirillales bacterium]